MTFILKKRGKLYLATGKLEEKGVRQTIIKCLGIDSGKISEQAVLERDSHTCQSCGAADQMTTALIVPFEDDSYNNMWCVCQDCARIEGTDTEARLVNALKVALQGYTRQYNLKNPESDEDKLKDSLIHRKAIRSIIKRLRDGGVIDGLKWDGFL